MTVSPRWLAVRKAAVPSSSAQTETVSSSPGMTGLENAHTHHLSGGEQRRLVVAAALVHRPSVVLLDEPTVGQDRNTWAAVMGLCTAAVAAGTGVAVASHDRDATDLLEPLGSVVRLELGRAVGEAA
jgi:energy-coupling factor transporter ATP-binding protein EcfA2